MSEWPISVNDEIREHLDDKYQELRAGGVREDEAVRLVLEELKGATGRGFVEPAPSEQPTHGAARNGILHDLWFDVRFAVRTLRQYPAFSTIVILTLGLGIGANTALFSVVNGVLLRPLPYAHPEQLVALHESKQNFPNGSISFPNFRDWRDSNHTFSAMAISRSRGFTLTGRGQAEQLSAQLVSSDFFAVLGVQPLAGRLFRTGEDEIGAAPLVLLGEGFWRRTLAASPSVVGSYLTLDGRDYTIIGIVPDAPVSLPLPNFSQRDVYVAVGQWSNTLLNLRSAGLGFHGIGRLKPGVTIEQARGDMAAVTRGLTEAYPGDNKGIGASIQPLDEALVGGVRPYLGVLAGAVGLVLLIACVNVSNLQLARSLTRRREMAVRAALGASPSRVIQQLIVESIVLACGGGALGFALAAWGTRAVLAALPTAFPRAAEVQVDPRAAGFTVAVTVLAGLLFGLAPAWRASRPDLQDTLRRTGRGATAGHHRTQAALVVAETALAAVLLVSAGLMIRTLAHLWRTDVGFRSDNVVTFGANLPPTMTGASVEAIRAANRQLHDTIAAAPGVVAASLSWGAVPLSGDDEVLFWPDGQPRPASPNDMLWAIRYVIDPDYVAAMRIPLLRGRFFTITDDERAPLVAVVDDLFARKFFPGADPIGRRVNVDMYSRPIEIVGVVGHVNQWGVDRDAAQALRAQMYLSFMQLPDQAMRQTISGSGVVVRTDGVTPDVLAGIRRLVGSASRDSVIYGAQTMQEIISESLATRRLAMILLAAFAIAALVLASLGIYGVLSHAVGQRTRELGVRIALGARPQDVSRLVIGQGLLLAVVGVGAGLVVATTLTRVMKDLLYGVSPVDPPTFAGVALILIVVALMACWIPARRATRADPMLALRAE